MFTCMDADLNGCWNVAQNPLRASCGNHKWDALTYKQCVMQHEASFSLQVLRNLLFMADFLKYVEIWEACTSLFPLYIDI